MHAVFIGGGSYRTLPIVRAAMSGRNVLRDGAIWLVDFNVERAETVGKLIMRTPEFAGSGCRVRWTDKLDKALPGAQAVSISFPVGSFRVCTLSSQACNTYGFPGSDQLSLSGAFRSLTGGAIVLDIARRMERHCSDAWLLIHANPVAVYSGMVNNHTRIKALGMCASCYHPHWDFTRLIHERDEYRDDYEIASAGVNHLTFAIRGRYKGRDIGRILEQKYGDRPWAPRLAGVPRQTLKTLHFSYRLYRLMWERFGILPCSNELEGEDFIFPDEFPRSWTRCKPLTGRQIRARERQWTDARRELDREFRAHFDRELDAEFWARPYTHLESRHFCAQHSDTTAVALKALGGAGPRKLAASLLCRGAVKGFKDRAVLEYSFTLDRKSLRPDPGLEIPDCFHGLISSLAAHQTLLGDAVAGRDPKALSDALFAFPVRQGSEHVRALWRELLKIHAPEIPPELLKAKDYFRRA